MRTNISDIYYNTDKVSQEEIDSLKSWSDFLKPQWKGRVVSILDPDSPVEHVTRAWETLGREWFERFIRESEPTLLSEFSPRNITDGLARGKFDVAFLATTAAEPDGPNGRNRPPCGQTRTHLQEALRKKDAAELRTNCGKAEVIPEDSAGTQVGPGSGSCYY